MTGARVDLREPARAEVGRPLFGEAQARIVITVRPGQAEAALARAEALGTPARRLGVVGGSTLEIRCANGRIEAPLSGLHDAWWNSIARAMNSP